MLGKTFETLERIFVFFTKSPKRNEKLKGNLLKTRWAARAVSVKAVWRGLQAILLVSLQNSKGGETKTKASSLLNFVRNIYFFCGLIIFKNVMFKTKMLSDYHQGEISAGAEHVAGALAAMSSTDGVLKR